MNTFILAFFFLTSAFNPTETLIESNPIDLKASTASWKGYKVLGSHEGTVSIKGGSLEFTKGVLVGGTIDVDMTSLSSTDLDGDKKGNLDGHLKSPDFFGVANFPTANFTITKVVSRGKAGDYKIKGNLTIKDITKEISFNATVTDKTANATLSIDRSDFNVQYGSGSFFDNLGDNTIYDEFDITINLVY